jgi:leucyl-tRNA---protein transferase
MLAQSYSPTQLHPQEIDLFLENGWFRMGRTIFTTNFLKFNGLYHSAIWLRIDLLAFSPTKTHQKLQRLNANFRVEFRPLTLKETHENLFANYKTGITFDAASSLQDLLLHDGLHDVYDTQEVCIYDQEKLIAAGFFDTGEKTMMGITCFYDPDYQKYSLGKYLMFLKMQYAQSKGMTHFYPGYFSPNYPIFDYKLDLAKPFTEYFELSSNTWKSIQKFTPLKIPIDVMRLKLRQLQDFLSQRDVEMNFYNYEFFDADLIPDFNGLKTFDFPVFLQYSDTYGTLPQKPIIVYDVRDSQFHLVVCEGIYNINFKPNNSEHFTSEILKITQHLFATELAEIMALVVATSFEVEKKSVINGVRGEN